MSSSMLLPRPRVYFQFIQQQAKVSVMRPGETGREEQRWRRRGSYHLFTILFYPYMFYPHCSNTDYLFYSLPELIKMWHAVGSRCVCDTVGLQVLTGGRRPHYMECNAQSLSVWSRRTLNHVPSHIYV